jgi:hypothetical protein
MGDVCIGTIEGTEFWVDKIYSSGSTPILLKVIDAFGVGGFSLETPLKNFQIEYRILLLRRTKLRTRKIH